jgi:hypothetical protein
VSACTYAVNGDDDPAESSFAERRDRCDDDDADDVDTDKDDDDTDVVIGTSAPCSSADLTPGARGA